MKRLVLLCLVVFMAALAIGLLLSQVAMPRVSVATEPMSAQSGATVQPSAVTLEGIVNQASALRPSTWVVDTYQFQVVAETEIISNGLTIQTGIWARVEAVKDEDQSLRASIVELQGTPRGELFDRLVAIDAGGVWQVGDTEVLVSDQTTVLGTPAVGETVYVQGRWGLGGLVASSATFQDSDDQVVYQGEISQLQAGQWLVDDVVVDLSGSPGIVGDPEIGSLVEVYGVETSPRHLLARIILVSSGTAELERRNGWLVSVAGNNFPYLWRVNLLDGSGITPVYLAVFENCEIDQSAASAQYRSWLDIEADNLGNGYYRARRIVVLPRPPKQTLTGIVEQMPETGLQGQWRVSGHRVEVVAGTAVVGAPQTGSLVTVLGTPDYSNALLAESIQVLEE